MAGLSRAYVGKKAFTKAAKVGAGARTPGEKGSRTAPGEKGNRRVEMNCGVVTDARVGPTADPADRAHGVMVIVDRKGAKDDGCTLLVPAAVRERRGRAGVRAARCAPSWHPTANLPARPRRYHASNMKGTLVEAGLVEDERGVPRRVVVNVKGRVSIDSVEDDLVERAARIKAEMGVDLLRGGEEGGRTGEEVLRQVRLRDVLQPVRESKRYRKADRPGREFIDRAARLASARARNVPTGRESSVQFSAMAVRTDEKTLH